MNKLRLGLNIDHVATVRNARGGAHPDPIRAALIGMEAGVDGITAHLREDRRHIRDEEIFRLKEEVGLPLNLEMAATDEMLDVALRARPNACCLVPERREELTTEGGLDVLRHADMLRRTIDLLREAEIRVSLFIEPDERQIESACACGADIVELHTGAYANASSASDAAVQYKKIANAVLHTQSCGLECHAGHGLRFDNTGAIAAIPQIMELNIGHFLIGEAIFSGLGEAIMQMRTIMDEGRNAA